MKFEGKFENHFAKNEVLVKTIFDKNSVKMLVNDVCVFQLNSDGTCYRWRVSEVEQERLKKLGFQFVERDVFGLGRILEKNYIDSFFA